MKMLPVDFTNDGHQETEATEFGRRELIQAIAGQYRAAGRADKQKILDEFIDVTGFHRNLKPEQSNIFFKLMEERYRQHSTIITTNLVYDEWPNFLGNRPMVEALLSRLRHYCHTVTINGPSLREPQG